MTESINQFLSEIKFVRKSLRNGYSVKAIHKPTEKFKEHKTKSLKEYTKLAVNQGDKQIKLSLWYAVHEKTRAEWIECIADDEVKQKLYTNIKVDMHNVFPSLANAILSSGLWSRWPEGKEYWEGVMRPIIERENKFQNELMDML